METVFCGSVNMQKEGFAEWEYTMFILEDYNKGKKRLICVCDSFQDLSEFLKN